MLFIEYLSLSEAANVNYYSNGKSQYEGFVHGARSIRFRRQ